MTREDNFKWDLEAIYKTDKDYREELNKLKKDITILDKDEMLDLSINRNLYKVTTDILNISRVLQKLYTYKSLKYNENIGDPNSIRDIEELETLNIEVEKKIAFYEPTLLKLKYSDIEMMYKTYPKLKEYEIYFKNTFRYKKYSLSKNDEKLISKLSKAYTDNEKVFSSLNDNDLTFGTIKDEEGNIVELTSTSYRKFMESKDRRVRKDAFEGLYKTYKQFKTTFSHLIIGHVKKNVTFSKIRGYKSTLEKEMYKDELDTKVLDSLIDSISDGLEPLYKFYRIKKQMLCLDEFHIYDTFAPTSSLLDKEYTYDEAKDIILDVTKVYGKEYQSIIKKAFDEKWIDVYPSKGKTTGAFSGGCYDTYPYILTNYQNRLNDVSTLIHELGHSVHSYYSRVSNPYIYSDYRIVVAEVASTVNELMLARYMLDKSSDLKEKLYILDNLLTLFKSTLYRQTMFEEFEKYLYDNIEKDNNLSEEDLSNYYYELNKKYFGKDVVIDDDIRYEWARIPHFYYNFYVYKYATGISSACYIVNSILENKKNAKENYIEFLKQGCRLAPNEELKIAGVDLTKKETYKEAIKMFSSLVDEYEKTYNELKRSGE